MLEIRNLHANVDGNEILRGIDLTVNAGEVYAIMGPNGSGKSTLAGVLAGRDAYAVTEGEVLFEGRDLLEMDPEERAREGLFMAFQYPVEIPGISNANFLRAAVNAIRKHRGQEVDGVQLLLAAVLADGIERGFEEVHVADAGYLDRILEGEEHALASAIFRRKLQQVLAVVRDLTAGDVVELAAGEHLGERALAGAVGAHDGVDLTGVNRKIDPFQDFASRDFGVEIFNFE